jgi:hypothetical protein
MLQLLRSYVDERCMGSPWRPVQLMEGNTLSCRRRLLGCLLCEPCHLTKPTDLLNVCGGKAFDMNAFIIAVAAIRKANSV